MWYLWQSNIEIACNFTIPVFCQKFTTQHKTGEVWNVSYQVSQFGEYYSWEETSEQFCLPNARKANFDLRRTRVRRRRFLPMTYALMWWVWCSMQNVNISSIMERSCAVWWSSMKQKPTRTYEHCQIAMEIGNLNSNENLMKNAKDKHFHGLQPHAM